MSFRGGILPKFIQKMKLSFFADFVKFCPFQNQGMQNFFFENLKKIFLILSKSVIFKISKIFQNFN